MVLEEGSPDILFNYETVFSGGPSASMVGIENHDGTDGLRYPGFDTPGEYERVNRSVLFYLGSSPSPDPDDPLAIDDDGDGYSENEGDCNDNNSSIHPGAYDKCGDGIDQNCDGKDALCSDPPAEGVDKDGDGFYTKSNALSGIPVDCNDNDPSIYPGAKEICGNGIDDNCDGKIDEGCAVDDPDDPLAIDNDGDNYSENEGDCNDNDPSIHPGAYDKCGDGIDQDCDGKDLSCSEPPADGEDNDGDGFYIDTNDFGTPIDCNDNDPLINPGAKEICGNGKDDNCDGRIDEGCSETEIPDGSGTVYRYLVYESPNNSWEEFTPEALDLELFQTSLATAVPLGRGNKEANVPPFTFIFYGQEFTNVYVAGNGYLIFTLPDTSDKYKNFVYDGEGLPAVAEPNNIIAPFWGESQPSDGLPYTAKYETLGTAPERRFVMEFSQLESASGGQRQSYQVVLYEKNNSIQFNYGSVVSAGADFNVAGIENSDGSKGLRYGAVDDAGTIENRSVLFYLSEPDNLLYMPLVLTNSAETLVGLINDSATESVTGVLQGRNDLGEVVDVSESLVLSENSHTEILVSEIFSQNIAEISYLTFESDTDVLGYVRLTADDLGVAGAYVAAKRPENSSDLYLPTVLFSNGWETTVSLVNSGDYRCNLTIEFDNGTSNNSFSLAPKQQLTLSMLGDLEVLSRQGEKSFLKDTDPHPTSVVIRGGDGLLGVATYINGETMSAIALNSKSQNKMVFPGLPDGDAWWTGAVLFNPASSGVQLSFNAYDADGNIVDLPGSDIELEAMKNQVILASDMVAGAEGCLKVEAETPVAGMEFWGTTDGRQMGGLSTADLSGPEGIFPLIKNNVGETWSGVVLANPEEDDNTVTLVAYDGRGASQGEARLTIPGYGQIAKDPKNLFLDDINGATFIRFTSEGKDRELIGLVFSGRRFENGGKDFMQLDALPALHLDAK